ncbi:quinon protein alcohol dehydrogenase-like superfamily [Ganoderma leucocontextum]|nr:quinon protein alcohol dehydrogenase-like superfamily [Ganoderma leucocontextum]
MEYHPAGKAGHDEHISTSIVISADSRWAATGSLDDGTIIIWDLESGSESISQNLFIHSPNPTAKPHPLAFPPDNRYIASTGLGPEMTVDDAVRIWEARTFQQLHPDKAWEGQLLALSPDGRRVLTGIREVGRMTRIWNVASPGKPHRALRVHAGDVFAAAFNSDSTRVVTAAADPTIRPWNAENGEAELLPLHSCFSPCSRYITLASEDGKAHLWRASDGPHIARVSGDERRVDRVAISPDGRVLCCARAKDGTVFFRRMCDLVPADQSR